jgi:hypothetical protein
VQFLSVWRFVEVEISGEDFIGAFAAQNHFTSGGLQLHKHNYI